MSLTKRTLYSGFLEETFTATGSVSGAATKLAITFQTGNVLSAAKSKGRIAVYVNGAKQSPTWTVGKTGDFYGTVYMKLTSSTMAISKPFFTLKVTMDGTYKATFSVGSHSASVSGSSGTLSYAIPVSWCDALPDSTKGQGTVTGQVLFGGSAYKTFTAALPVTVPDSVVPTLSDVAFMDTADSSVPSSWGIFVQNQSGLRPKSFTCAGTYGSSIEKVRLAADGQAQSAEYPDLPEIARITQSGSVLATLTVTDSRGRTASETTWVDFAAYASPRLSSVKSERCDASGNVDNDGTYFLSTTQAAFSSCSGKNALTMTVQYKRTDLPTYKNEKTIHSGPNVCGAGDLDPEYSYDVLYTLTDAFNTVTYSDYVSTAVYLMHFLHGGRGVAFGQKATMEDTLDCNFDGVFRKDLRITDDEGDMLSARDLLLNLDSALADIKKGIFDMVYPVGSIYLSVSSDNPSSVFGGTWVAWGSGRVPVGVDSSDLTFGWAEKTGGSKYLQSHKHTLSGGISSAGAHTHSLSGTATSVGAHTHGHSLSIASVGDGDSGNLQPYITCYMWKRTE